MRSLEQLDRWIAGKVKHWTSKVSGTAQGRELLEIRRDILEDVRDKIEPRGQGKSLFPFNQVAVRIAAHDSEEQQVRESAFREGEALQEDVAGLLAEAGCPAPSGLRVLVTVVEDGALAEAPRPFEIDYSNRKGAGSQAERGKARPTVKLAVVRGQTDAPEYTVTADRVNMGRLREVTGEKDGLRRRNDVAFADTETTVSREHAYIRYDAETGRFRVFDSGSQRGTSVFREGRRLDVPRGAGRGVQLQPGDEIHLGDARLRFDIEQG